jgi:plastocyanin
MNARRCDTYRRRERLGKVPPVIDHQRREQIVIRRKSGLAALTIGLSAASAWACTDPHVTPTLGSGKTLLPTSFCPPDCSPTTHAPALVELVEPAQAQLVSRGGGNGIVADVNIQGFTFMPTDLIIPRGATVKWTHNDFAPHTVSSTADPQVFESGTLSQTQTFSFTFPNVGRFDYICQFHFGMDGAVIVRLGGDANGDNVVNIGDFSVLASNFNQVEQTYTDGDFNLDGQVAIGDFAILAANFNQSISSRPNAVPEPATLGLLIVGITMSRRTRRP